MIEFILCVLPVIFFIFQIVITIFATILIFIACAIPGILLWYWAEKTDNGDYVDFP